MGAHELQRDPNAPTPTDPRPHRHFDVLIIGGGNAGISTAARLLRKGFTDVGIIESQPVHTYRPLLSYVGGGQATLNDTERTQRSVTPKGATWIRDSAVDIDPAARTVTTATGDVYGYRDLVLGTGLVPDHGALPGIDAALDSPAVASNYVDRAEKTWALVQSMPAGGHAVFTVPRAPVSCTGTTLKPLFLAADHWKRVGLFEQIDITLIVDRADMLGVPDLDARLRRHLSDLGVRVIDSAAVTSIEPTERTLVASSANGGSETITYDFLHLVPPFCGPDWLQGCGLTDTEAHGVVDIDSLTFRHRVFDDVWAVGDGAAIGTDPSGGGLRKQVSIMVDNLKAAREGGQMSHYEGYTVAPITVSSRALIAGEFDRTGKITSSIPSFLDPLKPRRSAWAFDRYGLPQLYWHSILKGRL